MSHRLVALALILALASAAPAGIVDLSADWQGHAFGIAGGTWPGGGPEMHYHGPYQSTENPNYLVGLNMACLAGFGENYRMVGSFDYNVNMTGVFDNISHLTAYNLTSNFLLQRDLSEAQVFADASVSLTGHLYIGASTDLPVGTPLALRVTPAQTGAFTWGLAVTTAAGEFDFAPGSGPADLAVSAGDTVSLSYFGYTNPNYAANPSATAVYTEGPYTDNLTANFEVVPEPATLSLLGLGFAALLSRRRRR